VPPVPRRLTQDRNHLIVCGDDALAYRIVEELTTNYHERVTVLLSSRARGHGPRIARLAGVRVIERPELDGTAFADAGAPSARAIALMGRDDLTNFHAALRAQDVSPGLRLVMRIFNTGLGERMRSFFPDCAVLSSSSMAAPSFVAAADLPRMLFGYKLGLVFLALFGVLVAGFVLLVTAGGFSPGNALYLTLLDTAGAAVTDPQLSGPEKVAQFMLTFDGMAFLPVVTAAVVGARLTGSVRGKERPLSGHVIVAGLGNVGTRIAGQLHDLGVDVVCVDRDENAAGIALARQLGLRVVIGETHREETLRAAGVRTSQALVSVTNSDIVNLETALHARALAADVRLVLRLSDDDLAERVQKTVGNAISRSVPSLAAPAFAAAMLEHQVLRTIPVGRHVLLIADVRVGAGSELAGQPVQNVHRDGEVRVIAVQRAAANGVDWSPRPDYVIAPQDRIYVLATRTGLSGVLARSQTDGTVAPA
jgi:Trk K+ transport system NAD-binding subunit